MTQMIDLTTPIAPSETQEFDNSLLEKGNYKVKLDAVKEWTPKVYQTFMATVYDDSGKALRASDGTVMKEKLTNVTIYSTVVTLKVTEGPRAGKLLFVSLSTNPNKPWELAKFVKGLGNGTVAPGEFEKYIGTEMEVSVGTETYPYADYIDKKTGETVYKDSKTKNNVTYYKPLEPAF